MVDAQPPSGTGPLGKREARLAWGLLTPTITAVRIGRCFAASFHFLDIR